MKKNSLTDTSNFQKEKEKANENISELTERAKAALSNQFFEEATAHFKIALEIDKKNPELNLAIGDALLMHGYLNEATTCFNYILSIPTTEDLDLILLQEAAQKGLSKAQGKIPIRELVVDKGENSIKPQLLVNGFFVASGSCLKIWNIFQEKQVKENLDVKTSRGTTCKVLSDGRLLVSNKHELTIVDLIHNTQKTLTEPTRNFIYKFEIVSDRLVVSISAKGGEAHPAYTFTVWDLISGECNQLGKPSEDFTDFKIISNQYVLCYGIHKTNREDNKMRVWDLNQASFKDLKVHKKKYGIIYLTVIDNDQVVTASNDRTIKVWDIKKNKCVKAHTVEVDRRQLEKLKNNGEIFRFRFMTVLPQNLILFQTNCGDSRVWNISTNECINVEFKFSSINDSLLTYEGVCSVKNELSILDMTQIQDIQERSSLNLGFGYKLSNGQMITLIEEDDDDDGDDYSQLLRLWNFGQTNFLKERVCNKKQKILIFPFLEDQLFIKTKKDRHYVIEYWGRFTPNPALASLSTIASSQPISEFTKRFQQKYVLHNEKIEQAKRQEQEHLADEVKTAEKGGELEEERQHRLEKQERENRIQALFDKGKKDYREGRFQSAVDVLTQLFDQYPEHEFTQNSYDLRGLCYMQLKKYEEASRDFHHATSYVRSSEDMSNLTITLERLGKLTHELAWYENTSEYGGAIVRPEQVLENHPENKNSEIKSIPTFTNNPTAMFGGSIAQQPPPPKSPAPKFEKPQAKAKHFYNAMADGELNFKETDIITIEDNRSNWHEEDWWYASLNGIKGYVPSSYFERMITNPVQTMSIKK